MANVIQGDSIARDVISSSIDDFTGWTGKWKISLTKGGTAIAKGVVPYTYKGSLTVSSDLTKMECRVPPKDGDNVLAVGECYLEIQVENAALQFRRTVKQEKLNVTIQGIIDPTDT